MGRSKLNVLQTKAIPNVDRTRYLPVFCFSEGSHPEWIQCAMRRSIVRVSNTIMEVH